jgi:hypothetical protein
LSNRAWDLRREGDIITFIALSQGAGMDAAMAKSKPIIITVTDAALDKIQSVAKQLTAKGMKVDDVLPVTGVIRGFCPVGKEETLKTVNGVHSVEDEVQVQLPPSDSEIQ